RMWPLPGFEIDEGAPLSFSAFRRLRVIDCSKSAGEPYVVLMQGGMQLHVVEKYGIVMAFWSAVSVKSRLVPFTLGTA
ncbi:MAG: hypothetical protein ACHREM_05675, partial [Polyangiales bacterium]